MTPDQVSLAPPLTCKTCKHWRQKPKPAEHLGQENRGDCYRFPPSVTTIQLQDRMGRTVGVQTLSSYPDLQESFPACGEHAARIEVSVNGQPK